EVADQQHAQQQFGVDRWPSPVAIRVLQLGSHKFEVDVAIDQAQQMIFRNLIFQAEVVKQPLLTGMVSHHKQQASERSSEQQHRELWPAYIPNLAPPQASTEGLFQQTQVISQTVFADLARAGRPHPHYSSKSGCSR